MALIKQKTNSSKKVVGQHLILRDHLAVDRTKLAVERAFLAYIRTGLTFLIAGVTGYNIFESVWLQGTGYMFVAVGVAIVLWGGWRAHRLLKHLRHFKPGYYEDF